MCGGGKKTGMSKKPPEPLKKADEAMQTARDDAARRQQAAAGFQASNITKGKVSNAKLGGGSKLGSA